MLDITIDRRPDHCHQRLVDERGEDPHMGCEVPGCPRDAGHGFCLAYENFRLRSGQEYLRIENNELREEIAFLKAHREALHETTNRYLERARAAEALVWKYEGEIAYREYFSKV